MKIYVHVYTKQKYTHIYTYIKPITVYNDVFACLCEHMYIYPRRTEDSTGCWMRIVTLPMLMLGIKNSACC